MTTSNGAQTIIVRCAYRAFFMRSLGVTGPLR